MEPALLLCRWYHQVLDASVGHAHATQRDKSAFGFVVVPTEKSIWRAQPRLTSITG
jgi:hypothetical protein